MQQREALLLREGGQLLRVRPDAEGVLAHQGKGVVRDAELRQRLDERSALRGDGIGNARRLKGLCHFNRTAFDAAHLKGRKNLQNLHGRLVYHNAW